MIERVSSTLATFKELRFGPGLNVLLADKSPGATERQTRNSTGKSSLIELIHFVLGGNADPDSIFRSEKLNKESFSLTQDVGDTTVTVSRSGSKKNDFVVDGSSANWPLQPELDKKSGETRFSAKQWNHVLGNVLFQVPNEAEAYFPSFRSMFSYFVRRENSGGFQHAEKQAEMQQLYDVQINVSHLLGLDWMVPLSLQQLRDKEKTLEMLRKEAKSGVLGNLVGDSAELRTRLTVAESKARRLEKELEQFQVLPEYRELEQEASVAAREISSLANENTLDEERAKVIEEQLHEETEPSSDLIVAMYERAQIELPNLVVKRLEDVRAFHEAVISNRRSQLQGEIDDARSRLAQRRSQMDALDVRRREIMNLLSSYGALDQMLKLQSELSRLQAEVLALRKRLELAVQVEEKKTELTIERARIQQELFRDIRHHDAEIREAILIFEDLSRRISDHEGSLQISATENGPTFKVVVEGGRSVGIRNMQIFCFDMMLAILWSKRKLGPGFLIHDSHLFDGMDSRQIAKALEIGAEQSKEHDFQYIVTMNSDAVPMGEFSKGFDWNRYVNPVRLNDATETGGLFGVRI
ncbi:MAG: DUF2326 domain-containing protein [Planctomycetota bacterium]|nr:DUF2326 domain-containing protein [Planctomycetota bacterium]